MFPLKKTADKWNYVPVEDFIHSHFYLYDYVSAF